LANIGAGVSSPVFATPTHEVQVVRIGTKGTARTFGGMRRNPNAEYAVGLTRAFGGALIFAFPLTMTMEMWWLGFYMGRSQLLLFMTVNLVLLIGLSHFAGFEKTSLWSDDLMDAFAAFAIGAFASAAMLILFGIITSSMSTNEIVGKIALQSIPASIGAMLSRKQLGSREADAQAERNEAGYSGELFLMGVGALYLAFNVAPTEEMVLIAHKMSALHALALVFLSVAILHSFVYTVGFAGQKTAPEGASVGATLLHYSVVGYAIAVLVSLYVLWTFGRIEGVALFDGAKMVAVLGFPAAIGAALARLLV
jgi:putative integral membrane protein (TIGR02587 family)